MNEHGFQESIVDSFYIIGREYDALKHQKRELRRKMRVCATVKRLQHSAQRLDMLTAYFAAGGAVPLIMMAGHSDPKKPPQFGFLHAVMPERLCGRFQSQKSPQIWQYF